MPLESALTPSLKRPASAMASSVMPSAQQIDLNGLVDESAKVDESLWSTTGAPAPVDFAKSIKLLEPPEYGKRVSKAISLEQFSEQLVNFVKEDDSFELNDPSGDLHPLDVDALFADEGKTATRVMYHAIEFVYKTLYEDLLTNSGDLKFIEWCLHFLPVYQANAVIKLKEFISIANSSCGGSVRVEIKRPCLSRLSNKARAPSKQADSVSRKERIESWLKSINDTFGALDEVCSKVSCVSSENLKFASMQCKMSKFDQSNVSVMSAQFKFAKRLFVFTKMHDSPSAQILTLEGDARDMIISSVNNQVTGVDLKISDIVKICSYKKVQTMMVYKKYKNGFETMDGFRKSGSVAVLIDSLMLSPQMPSQYGNQNIIKLYPLRLQKLDCSMFDFAFEVDDD